MVSYSYNKFKSSNSIRLNNYLYSKIAVGDIQLEYSILYLNVFFLA